MTAARLSNEKKILIVEDHPLFRAMLVRLVEQEGGMTVCGEADSTQEALRLSEATRPDAALVDLGLRGSSGLELITEWKVRDPRLPVLVLSSHEEGIYVERALRAGARGYVSKQESPKEVVVALHQILAGGTSLSERIAGSIRNRPSPGIPSTEPGRMDRLTGREMEIFQLMGSGLNAREIAGRLGLGAQAVDRDQARIKEKLDIKNATELYQRAAQWVAEGDR